jgi:hypothetical protein
MAHLNESNVSEVHSKNYRLNFTQIPGNMEFRVTALYIFISHGIPCFSFSHHHTDTQRIIIFNLLGILLLST